MRLDNFNKIGKLRLNDFNTKSKLRLNDSNMRRKLRIGKDSIKLPHVAYILPISIARQGRV